MEKELLVMKGTVIVFSPSCAGAPQPSPFGNRKYRISVMQAIPVNGTKNGRK